MRDKSFKPMAVKDLLEFLFRHIHHPEDRPYSVTEVADATGMSYVTIYTLLQGRSKKPTLPTVQALCDFFGVPLNFFECKSYDECYGVLENIRKAENEDPTEKSSPQLGEIMFRAQDLSPEGQQDLLTLIKWVQAAERERKSGRDVPNLPILNDREENDEG